MDLALELHADFAPILQVNRRAFSPGQRLENYVLDVTLGEGSYGQVWKAWDTAFERFVALKLLGPGDDPDERFIALVEEARAAAGIRHPNVVDVRRVGKLDQGWMFLELELCADATPTPLDPAAVSVGKPLSAIGGENGRPTLSHREAARIVAQAARGVAAAHARGVIHRDLKPGNILISPLGRVLVADFGLAAPALLQDRQSGGPVAPKRSTRNLVYGAPSYMAPEHARGEPALPVSDVYGLGATLFFLLAARHPYERVEGAHDEGESKQYCEEVIRRVADAGSRPLPLPSNVPRQLVRICQRAMAKESADRYQSAAELAADLEAWVAFRVPPSVGPAGTTEALALWVRRNLLISVVALTAVSSVAGITLWYIHGISIQRARQSRVVEFLKEFVLRARADLGDGLPLHKDVVASAAGSVPDRFGDDPVLAGDLLEWMGTNQLEYRDPEAMDLLEQSASIRRTTLGADHLETIDTDLLRAIAMRTFGRRAEAKAVLADCLARRSRVAGQWDENTFIIRINLHAVDMEECLVSGTYEPLRAMLPAMLSISDELAQHLGPEHAQTLAGLHNLARAYEWLGQPEKSEPVLRNIARLNEADLPSHGTTLDSLAQAVESQGRLEEALDLYERASDVKERALGAGVRDTLLSRLRAITLGYRLGKLSTTELMQRVGRLCDDAESSITKGNDY